MNCKICLVPEKCDCLCLTCQWARLNLLNPAHFISRQEFLSKWTNQTKGDK